jgi:hypothetical protein
MGQRGLNLDKPLGLPLAYGAHRVAQARREGMRPADPIIVSYVGPTPWQGVHVLCESGKAYDWAWSEDLTVAIVMAPGIDAMGAIRGCFWPCKADAYLTLIDIEKHLVSYVVAMHPKPKLWHLKDVSEYFPQEPVACN